MSDPSILAGEHEAVQQLLPWFATGALEPAERARVDAHLSRCSACHADLEAERRFAVLPADTPPTPDAGWARMAARLDRPTSAVPSSQRVRQRPWARRTGGPARRDRLRWALVAQFAVILMLAGWIAAGPSATPPPHQSTFRALGAADVQRPGNVLAMFRPDTTEAELRRLLTESGARLADGPTSAGAYVLIVPGGPDGRALATLRRNAAVTMAEPIGQPSAP